jgi:uncharacterized membrane protein (DUF2068 family)
VGLRLVIAYKLVKAFAELALAGTLAMILASGGADTVREAIASLSRPLTSAWSLRLSALVARAASAHAVVLTIGALLLDGLLTACEGWALHRRFVWAPWLVVVATGSLLPFEVVELVRRPHAVRLMVFVVNLTIVCYLAARATREIRRRRQEETPSR